MKPHRLTSISIVLVLLAVTAVAENKQASTTTASLADAPPISKETRMNLIRAFNAELVYIRTQFPMGKRGLTLENGKITPSGQELEMMVATYGPAAKPGDLARITNIDVKKNSIRFEINGGPIKKKKWYQRIEVGGMGGTTPIAPSDPNANPRGSFVDLQFDRSVPELTPQQLKDLLRSVFDFDAKSAVEAYLDTVPPKVKEAIKNHKVLVGMNHEMVIYSKGRPPKKIREKDGDTEYEEWIYGEPPSDMEFVRFVGDEVVRLEIMKVGGEKSVRTEREIEVQEKPTVAQEPTVRPANAPTLRRPGEELPDANSTNSRPSGGGPPMPPPPPPSKDGTPQPNQIR
jgi:hypothetical protein